MKHTPSVSVSIHIEGQPHKVGEMAANGKMVFFKYAPTFLSTPLQISPFKLPFSDQPLEPNTPVFDGLFGVFHDSLPDGWGQLLIDRALRAKGIPLQDVTPLDRLCMVSHSGNGALCYQPANTPPDTPADTLQLDAIAEEAQRIWAGEDSLNLDQMVRLGGSSGGARPKILAGFNPTTHQLIPDNGQLPDGYEHWIIKFPSGYDPADIGAIEYAYYKMALDAGIEMSECRLFQGESSGRNYFGTKRFDRIQNNRLHLHSAAGLLHDNYRLSNMDYGHLMDAAFRLEKKSDVYTKVLRLATFNILSNNMDDHSKNFSFLMDAAGQWRFAPAYDLTFSNTAHGHHSTTVAGESKAPTTANIRHLAQVFGVENIAPVIEQVRYALNNWAVYAQEYGITKASQRDISQVIKNRDR